MNQNVRIVSSHLNAKLRCSAIPGHFATSNSHVNYYLDMIEVRSNHKLARLAAKEFAQHYETTPVDTIICIEGTEVIGAFLADELCNPSHLAVNTGHDINVLLPELATTNQMVFRENTRGMVADKNVLLMVSCMLTGKTVRRAVNMLRYYSANLIGVGALYSLVDQVDGIPVSAIFTNHDLPDYQVYKPCECAMCQQHRKLDAIANGYGYTRLD